MNTGGLLFWIVAVAMVGLVLIAVGLLGAMARARPGDVDADREAD